MLCSIFYIRLMKRYFFWIGLLGFYACQSPIESNKVNAVDEDSLITDLTEKVAEIIEEDPGLVVPDCLPEPSLTFLEAKQEGNLMEKYAPTSNEFPIDEIYLYFLLSTDSLSEKKMLRKEPEYDLYIWQQEFNGATYTYNGYQSGAGGEITSRCTDRSQFLKVIDAVVKHVPCDDCYNPEMKWYKDSTVYGVGDGEVGCNYYVENDSLGKYRLYWYCGC